jgi:hypothetical protein
VTSSRRSLLCNRALASLPRGQVFLLHPSSLDCCQSPLWIRPQAALPCAPRLTCTRNKSSVPPNQIGFTHQWLQAIMPFFLVQPHTNCQGSKQFPNFALFTTLLGRVRLSQSVGCETMLIIPLKALMRMSSIGCEDKDSGSIFGVSNPSIDVGSPCIKGAHATHRALDL